MDFTNMKSLIDTISNDLTETILDDVIEKIKETESEVISDVIYQGVFQPNYYDRRGSENGGLGDKENMKASYITSKNGVSVEVVNETRGNDSYENYDEKGYIAGIIESGEGYTWGRRPNERPFTELTSEKLENENIIENEIARSMRNKGYIVE